VYAGAADELIAETSYTIFAEHEWTHVSVSGDTVGSVAWERYGEEVQLLFYAYNDTGLIFHQEVIEANKTYSDPFEKYMVYWEGEISVEDEILLKFFSFSGQTTTVVGNFVSEPAPYDRPGTTFLKPIITRAGDIKAVFVADNSGELDKHVCSFEWVFQNVTSSITNITRMVPTMLVYEPDGEQYDTKSLSTSSTMSPISEYWAEVGFMFEKMDVDEDYVKWIVYSGQDFRIGTSPEFRDKDLQFFSVEPDSLRVEPGQIVTVTFVLPEGITEYDVSWEQSKIWDHIYYMGDDVSPNGEHEVTFYFLDSFLDGRRERTATIGVSCEQYGATYSDSNNIRVHVSGLVDVVLTVCLVIGILIGSVLGLRFFYRRRADVLSCKEVSGRFS